MAPPLVDESGDGGRQKYSRKMKRLRDASCMRKRETRQDRWGRQRGGRKARWEKLDRQPAALKTRLGATGSPHDHIYDTFDVLSPVAKDPPHHVSSAEAEGGTFARASCKEGESSILSRDGVESPCSTSEQQRTPSRVSAEDEQVKETPPVTHEGSPLGTTDEKPPAAPNLPLRGGSGSGVRGRRSSLRSPSTGASSLSRSSSAYLDSSGSSSRLGAFRGSPPPFSRRLSTPVSAERGRASGEGSGIGTGGKLSQKSRQRQQSGKLDRQKKTKAATTAESSAAGTKEKDAWDDQDQGEDGEQASDEGEDARMPPLPPSLFDSVFKNKLPSLTPRKAPPATPRLSKDSIVHAIFQALFGKRRVRSGPKERYGGNWDDEEEDEDAARGGEDEEVDESWIKTGISLSLFSSKAVDFACRSTAGADLMHEYVDSNAVFRLVTDLRFEDPRVPSPRLMIVKAIYENCPHLRIPTVRALAHASHDHLMRTRELEAWAARVGLDISEATAAAVAGGSKVPSTMGGTGVENVSGGSIGQGSISGSVRVMGRDQSQTLGDLLMHVLETFPLFFLGVAVPPSSGANAVAMAAPAGVAAADNGGMATVTGNMDGQAPSWENEGSEGFSSPDRSASSSAPPVPSGALRDETGVTGTGAEYTGQEVNFVQGCEFGEGEGSSSSSPAGSRSAIEQVLVPTETNKYVGSPGGGSRSNATLSPGGEPVMAAELSSPAWPRLEGSPLSKQTSPSQQKQPAHGGGSERTFSPAGAATTGLRELEETGNGAGTGDVSGDVWGARVSTRAEGGAGDGIEDGGVWGDGRRSARLLAWGSPGKAETATTSGPARALRFTLSDGDDGGNDNTTGGVIHQAGPGAGDSVTGSDGMASEQIAVAQDLSQTWDGVPAELQGSQATTISSVNGEGIGPASPASPMPGPSGVVLKEAARSLCNLYASHGAAAAGAEAAASADMPERLEPLASMGSVLCQLWPQASIILLRRLLGSWPTGSSRREVAYLRFIAGIACGSPPVEVMSPGSRVPFMMFRRISQCINSPNTKVAQEAAFLVQADFIVMSYLAHNRRLMDFVTNALHANRDHWSMDVRNASDQAFDLMLDYL